MITPDKVYAHLDRLAAWRAGETPAPVTLEWDLTNRCSRGCDGCHFAHTHSRGPLAARRLVDTGDQADPAMVRRALAEAAALGVRGIVWTGGGEPTLHPDFDAIVAHAATLGLRQGLYTHGGHLDAARAARLRDTLAWAVVSLDAPDEASYRAYKGPGFRASCDGVRALAGGACRVGVSFLLGAENWPQTGAMLALARSLGATYTTFRPMVWFDPRDPARLTDDRGWITDALPTLAALAGEADVVCDPQRFVEYRDWRRGYDACYGIRLNATITPDGRVWLCPNRRGLAGSDLGSLQAESFAAIWARHPGVVTDFAQCRAMCRLHQVNERLAVLERPLADVEFV